MRARRCRPSSSPGRSFPWTAGRVTSTSCCRERARSTASNSTGRSLCWPVAAPISRGIGRRMRSRRSDWLRTGIRLSGARSPPTSSPPSTIEALIATGDSAYAWTVVKENPKVGVLTLLATAHLALHDGRLDTAAHELRALASDQTLGPAQRAEAVLLSGWLELARTGEIDAETARQISRISQRADRRRLLEVMPRQLVDRIKEVPGCGSRRGVGRGDGGHRVPGPPSATVAHLGRTPHPQRAAAQRSTANMASSFHVSPNTVKSRAALDLSQAGVLDSRRGDSHRDAHASARCLMSD